MIYWFIGQPHSGKSTLAKSWYEIECSENRIPPIFLDGDDLRKIAGNAYTPETFTREWRIEQTIILQRWVAYLADQDFEIIVATVNPYREVREQFKKSRRNIKEIYVHTTNIRGRENFHVQDFEPPLVNFIDIDTTDRSIEECGAWMYANL